MLFSHIDSFRIFIKRHGDISPARKKRHSNYLRLVKNLANMFKGDTESLNKIKVLIEKMKPEGIAGLNLINEKIRRLEKE